MSEHTPTPWAVEEVRTSIGRCFKIGSPEMLSEASKKPTYLCVYDDHGVGENIQKANAAFIVKAVNSHEALVKLASKLAREVLSSFELFEPLARREIGNTNYRIIVDDAKSVIASIKEHSK